MDVGRVNISLKVAIFHAYPSLSTKSYSEVRSSQVLATMCQGGEVRLWSEEVSIDLNVFCFRHNLVVKCRFI